MAPGQGSLVVKASYVALHWRHEYHIIIVIRYDTRAQVVVKVSHGAFTVVRLYHGAVIGWLHCEHAAVITGCLRYTSR